MIDLARIDSFSNAFTFSFDDALLEDIKETYQNHILPLLKLPEHAELFAGGEIRQGPLGQGDELYYICTYDKEPLIWLSNNNLHTYTMFKKFFDALNLKEAVKGLVNFDEDIILYSGFLVIGDRAYQEAWHVDYVPSANAYTLITPLSQLAPEHGNLLFQDADGDAQTYTYNYGDAIIFGDHFMHSTEPYAQSETPRVLVSLTFGTDKFEHWPALKQTIGEQSEFMVLPCGHAKGSCRCQEHL